MVRGIGCELKFRSWPIQISHKTCKNSSMVDVALGFSLKKLVFTHAKAPLEQKALTT